jgi:hypothetical protein
MATLTLSEQDIRTILVGLAAYSYDLSKEVEKTEAETGNPADFARMEYDEVRTLIRKIREA